jgi:hypothetical protein
MKQRPGGGGGGCLLLICNVIKIPEYMSYGHETYLSKMGSMKKHFQGTCIKQRIKELLQLLCIHDCGFLLGENEKIIYVQTRY